MKKILTLILALTFALLLTTVCFAEEEASTVSTAANTTAILPAETTIGNEAVNTLPIATTAVAEEIIPSVTTSTEEVTEPDAEEESFADYCLGWIMSHISEILSTLSLAGTAAICLLAKKSLLPILTAGLNKVTEIVAQLEGAATKLLEKNSTQIGDITKEAERLTATVAEAEARVEKIAESVNCLTNSELDAAKDRELVKTVMVMQAELFHTLIANSSLPQWRKDDFEKKYKDTLDLIKKDSDNV